MWRLVFLSIGIVLSLLPVIAPAAPDHKRPTPRWHGYGFLPGYHQPPNNSLPAYAQKASVSRMARHNRRPWYIDPIPRYYGYDGDWHYFGRPAWLLRRSIQWRQFRPLLDADSDWADLELRLIKLTLKDRACACVCSQRQFMAQSGHPQINQCHGLGIRGRISPYRRSRKAREARFHLVEDE
jgi:hypothetical protein